MAAALPLLLSLCLAISIPSLAVATAANNGTTITAANGTTTANATDLIRQVCNHTLYADFCVKSLSAEHTSQGADVQGLAAISLRLSAESAATTSSYISGLLEGAGDDAELEQCLSDCSEGYMDAVEQLDDSTAAIDAKAYNDVNAWVSAAMTDTDSCDDGCKGVDNKKKAELVERNGNFNKMCSITLTLTNLLAN